MSEYITTINIPGISGNLLKYAQDLDMVLYELSMIDEHHIMICPFNELNRIKRLVDNAQRLHQTLIACHVAEKSNNHPMWTTTDKLATEEIKNKLEWMHKQLVNGKVSD